MIEREKIIAVVKAYLPQIDAEVASRIADDIVKDVESIAYSMIRQNVAQQREQLYWNSIKN
ncbi:MAG: hypothetical protein P4N41_15650 [Negativicutes bacterium]|nr:hypothetical protein [Negativicutes bacterium]